MRMVFPPDLQGLNYCSTKGLAALFGDSSTIYTYSSHGHQFRPSRRPERGGFDFGELSP